MNWFKKKWRIWRMRCPYCNKPMKRGFTGLFLSPSFGCPDKHYGEEVVAYSGVLVYDVGLPKPLPPTPNRPTSPGLVGSYPPAKYDPPRRRVEEDEDPHVGLLPLLLLETPNISPPAPEPEAWKGDGGTFSGGGASGSWDPSPASESSPSSDSSSSDSGSSSSDSSPTSSDGGI